MMCGHCEARVKKTILAYKGVKSAEVSHTLGRAVVEMENDCDIEGLKKAIEDQDYKVVSFYRIKDESFLFREERVVDDRPFTSLHFYFFCILPYILYSLIFLPFLFSIEGRVV